MSRNDVTVDDLCLVKFNTKHYSDELVAWFEDAKIPFAESCDSQVWYGRKEDFDDFPYPEGQGNEVHKYEDEEAYKFMLELVSGSRSKKIGETHVKSQFYDGWRTYSEQNPDEAKDYQRFVSVLKKDVKHLQEDVAAGMKPTRSSTTARDLSGQKKGDSVLIIGSVGRGGVIGGNTREMITVTENRQDPSKKIAERGEYLTMTHPNPDKLAQLEHEVGRLKTQGIFRSSVQFVPFDQLSEQVETQDRVYVDISMREGEEPLDLGQAFNRRKAYSTAPEDLTAESEIIAAWSSRVRQDNTLTHLRGNPATRMTSSQLWKDAENDMVGYISPEDIIEENTSRRDNNNDITQAVSLSIDELAYSRANGDTTPARILLESDRGLDGATHD